MGRLRTRVRDDAGAATHPAAALAAAATRRTTGGASHRAGGNLRMRNIFTRAAVLCLMLGATSIFLANARKSEVGVTRTSFETFPMTINGWRATVDPPLSQDILRVLGVDDYLSRIYYRDGAAVGLYMGFYGSQRQGDTIHSPMNCLPGAGWQPVQEGRLTIDNADGAGRDITVNR